MFGVANRQDGGLVSLGGWSAPDDLLRHWKDEVLG